MPTEAFETLLSPYSKLMRANMELIAKFSTAPEVMARTLGTSPKLSGSGLDAALGAFPVNAFNEFLMGLAKNWMEFLTDLGQSALSLVDQGQDAFLKRGPAMASDAARAMTEAAQGKTPRVKPAAT